MANTRFQYVKKFETYDSILMNCYFVVRIDGRGFTEFCDLHKFEKPNDLAALKLMNKAAKEVMKAFNEIVIAYGESDEYSFGFGKSAHLYNRRKEKILSSVVSSFSSAYVFYWSKYFPKTSLKIPPAFDARIVLYPSLKNLQDYFAWRQADTHINNLYNTTFWCLVKSGMSKDAVHKKLKGTESKEKNEILFSQFKINYNDLPEIFKKGTVLIRVLRNDTKPKKNKQTEKDKMPEKITEDNKKEEINEAEEKKETNKLDKSKSEGVPDVKEKKPVKQILRVHESVFGEEFWMKYNLNAKLD